MLDRNCKNDTFLGRFGSKLSVTSWSSWIKSLNCELQNMVLGLFTLKQRNTEPLVWSCHYSHISWLNWHFSLEPTLSEKVAKKQLMMSAFGNIRVALVSISFSGSLVTVLLKTNFFHVVSMESPLGPLYVLSHIYCEGSGGLWDL